MIPGWTEKPPPWLATALYRGAVATAADLTLLRGDLHKQILRSRPTGQADEEDVERLLLTFEELASNGLRHGRRPVQVTVYQGADGWLVDVTDAAVDRPPIPAVDRDPARGGLGLYLVARLSAAHGWWSHGGRKHVWALVGGTAPA